MDDLLEFVAEDKREAFGAKFKGAGYLKLTDDLALDYVTKSQSLRDKVSTPVAEAALKNFQEKKLPEILKTERENIRKEFAPKEETPEQKELREMREWKQTVLKDKQTDERKAALRKKAADLKYDPLKAEKLYALEDAEVVLADLASDRAELLKKIEDLEKQAKYGANPPAGGTSDGPAMSEAEFMKLDAKARAEFMVKGGRLK